jgi:uncharacterized protein DUF4349
MSQRDLAGELRAARITAPAEVRARVRHIAAADTTARGRRFDLTWRKAFVLAVPVAAAVAGAIVATHPFEHRQPTAVNTPAVVRGAKQLAVPTVTSSGTTATPQRDSGLAAPSSGKRAQDYEAYLSLRVRTPDSVSDGVKRALRITSALGGYPTSVHASSKRHAATADLTVKVPRRHIQEAIARFSAIGTITGEQLDVQDVQAGIDNIGATITRLQRKLRALRAQPQTPVTARTIAAVTASIERLQRARAQTLRAAQFATVQLHLGTPQAAAKAKHGHGPLHGLGVAFRWIGIGAVYALALGGPLVVLLALAWLAARMLRRRREDALLSQS